MAHHQNELQQRIAHRDHCYHQLHEAHQNKARADTNLVQVQNTIRQQQETQAAHIAQMEAVRLQEQQEAKRKADEAAEALRQIAEAARIREQQEAQNKTEEADRVAEELIAARAVEDNDAGRVASQFSALAISQPALPSGDQDFDSNAAQPAGTSASSHETFKNENTSFGSKQVLDLHKELEAAKKTGDDTQAIYDKYANISRKNREQSVAESGNVFSASAAFTEAEGAAAIANSLNRFPVFSSLTGEELSQLNRFVQAENEATASAIYQAMPNSVKVALSVKEAVDTLGLGAAVGSKPLAALGVVGKGSPLPTPMATVAANGLSYQSNQKHTPGQKGYSFKAGTEPADSINLFGSFVASGEKRYAKDADGNVHQFTNTNDGTWHWSGSTGDKSSALDKNTIPSEIRKKLDLPKKGW